MKLPELQKFEYLKGKRQHYGRVINLPSSAAKALDHYKEVYEAATGKPAPRSNLIHTALSIAFPEYRTKYKELEKERKGHDGRIEREIRDIFDESIS